MESKVLGLGLRGLGSDGLGCRVLGLGLHCHVFRGVGLRVWSVS